MASTVTVGASSASSPAVASSRSASATRPAPVVCPSPSPSPSPSPHRGGSTSATISSANKSRTAVGTGLRPGRIVRKKTQQQQVVQWKTRNVQEGIVIVDEAQLSKLIKRDPIEKFYDMDPEPFATGLFASVRRCRSRDSGLQLAAKFSSRLRYGSDCSAEIHHEIALLSLCSPSPRVVKLHDVFQTEKEIILVMEYAPGGDLQTLIDDNIVPYESDVVSFTRQLVEGLAYLHHRKIAHLDIKPQNLVMMGDFPDCDVKLCDFEISRVILEGTEIREILGTPDYVAPEILHYEPITMAADMWSLGVTVYVLLTGFSPFGGETDQETFCNISRAQLDFPEELFEDVSAEAQDFIRRLLQRDPRSRPSAKECLRHPWLSQRGAGTAVSGEPGRARGCASCSPPGAPSQGAAGAAHSLRKYLSKSREALFERVLQRGVSVGGGGGSRIAHQLAGRGRLCESQASLVSKTRERDPLFTMSPSLSRSREKLYGLRSLSRSQEVLAMCRALSQLQLHCLSGTELDRLDQEDDPEPTPSGPSEASASAAVTPGIPAEPSAGTASSSPEAEAWLDHPQESPPAVRPSALTPVACGSGETSPETSPLVSTSAEAPIVCAPTRNETNPITTSGVSRVLASFPSSADVPNDSPENASELCSPKISEPSGSSQTTAETPVPGNQPDPPVPPSAARASCRSDERMPSFRRQDDIPPSPFTPWEVASPSLPQSTLDFGSEPASLSSGTETEVFPDKLVGTVPTNGALLSSTAACTEKPDPEAEAILSALRNGLLARGALTGSLRKREPDLLAPVMVAAATTNGCQYEDFNGNKATGGEPTFQREQSTLSSNSESSESTLEGEEDAQGDDEYPDDMIHCVENEEDEENESEDEPRFTVAQLITAYNLHDEVVTKSSLDFTMATTDREAKLMPPVLNTKSKFPTGPNALRLFIPDIDITNAKPRKSKSSRKAGLQSLHEEDGETDGAGEGADNRTGSFLRSESLSSTTSTMTISWEELSSQPSKHQQPPTSATAPSPTPCPPPTPPPLPPLSALPEPKKSPKPIRAATVRRHRRSASTPTSDTGRTTALSPAGKATSVERSGSNRVGGSVCARSSKKVSITPTAEKSRRKSTPIFK